MKYKVLGKQNNTADCFVCGMNNDFGTKAVFYDCENEDGEKVLLGILNPKPEHQSYPNRMHGGVIAALLDEVIGRAHWINNPNEWGVTMELTTRYRKPVPLDQTLYIEGIITEKSFRGFNGTGKLFTADGTVCATATARYLIMPVDKIVGDELDEKNWFLIDEDLPNYIELK